MYGKGVAIDGTLMAPIVNIISKTSKTLWIFYCGLALSTIAAALKYPGQVYSYILFSIVFNALLFMGFRKNKIFFDTFIGILFWLGFWLKYTFVLLFCGYIFVEPIGDFDYSGISSDYALLVCTVGGVALMMASCVRERYLLPRELHDQTAKDNYIALLYRDYRKLVLASFVLLFIFIAASNVWFGIYQRGLSSRTVLLPGLKGVYTWLLLFGMASFSSVIIDSELRYKSNIYLAATTGLLESFFSSVSMLSRAMIVNAGFLMFGANEVGKNKAGSMNGRFKIAMLAIFIALFVGSVFMVNVVRGISYSTEDSTQDSTQESLNASYLSNAKNAAYLINVAYKATYRLCLNRWVGIEGVLAISSHGNLGPDLWAEVWREKYSDYGTSYFDREIAKAPYRGMKLVRHHFITMPGILGFFYYKGSLPFLFAMMFAAGMLGALIEIGVYKTVGSNLILCSVIAGTVAYRYAHFGYAPGQSYLLFGSIFANIFIIFLLNKICKSVVTRNGRIKVSAASISAA